MWLANLSGIPILAWPWVKTLYTPDEHPNPTTKIKPKMGGEFTYQPKWDPKTVLTLLPHAFHSSEALSWRREAFRKATLEAAA